jgi:hypothetical protein
MTAAGSSEPEAPRRLRGRDTTLSQPGSLRSDPGEGEVEMPVSISSTPNPNAVKFTVGVDVGGPKSFVSGGEIDDPVAASLAALPGVASVFMSSDFVTLSKLPDAAWDPIIEEALPILEARFG